MDYADDVDVDRDAEGELEHDSPNGMTLVDPAGGLSALGVPPPSTAAASATTASASPSVLAAGGVGKRYRPAPAKTFQCRGYGECRMVFSRSEHLARHIRKHTGERPFTCHCSKQFSRLDNLRQHAQTVHADKAAQNETMMRELTTLHASMTGAIPSTPGGAATSPGATGGSGTGNGKGSKEGGSPKEKETSTSTSTKRPGAKRARASGAAVKREPVEEGLSANVMAQRPGTSTGYEGAAGGLGYMDREDVEMDMDEPPTQRQRQKQAEPSPPLAALGRARSFRRDAPNGTTHSNGSFRNTTTDSRDGSSFRDGPFRSDGSFRDGGEERERQSFLAPGAVINTSLNSHSGGRGESFRGIGPQYVRRSPPAHTPSPPTPSFGGNGNGHPHRLSSGSFSAAGRPFSSGNDAIPPGSSFPAPGSRPSTGGGARLPPLSAVVSSSAFRPSSGHGIPAPAAGGILLPNSLTLRRPSTGDWEWGDPWNVRPGTAPGKLATAAVDDSPFSFHPPDQPASSSFAFNIGGGGYGSGSTGNPRKRAFGSPDGPYGAYPDDEGSGGYEYGSESRPQSRRLTVMELCNDDDDAPQRPASSVGLSSLRRAGSTERPTTTNGLVSRASALVLSDNERNERTERGEQQQSQREHEPWREHFATERVASGNGIFGGGGRLRSGSVRGLDAAPSGGATQAVARPTTGGGGRGSDGGGGVPSAAAGGAGSAFLPSAAAATAAGGGGSLSHAGAASPPAGGGGAGLSRPVHASPPRAARDGHGFDGAGDDGGISVSGGNASAYGTHGPVGFGAGGVSSRGGLAGAGIPGGFGVGVPTYLAAAASASPPSPPAPTARASASASPPSAFGAARDAASRGAGAGLPSLAVFARVPAYAAALPPLRSGSGDDGPLRGGDGHGLRYAGPGRAEVREFAGRGAGAAGYEYEYEYEHEHGHRVGSGRSGGMRV